MQALRHTAASAWLSAGGPISWLPVMKFFWEVFVTLFVIIDPAGTVPVFLGLTRGRSRQDRDQLAWQATIVAFGVIAGQLVANSAIAFAHSALFIGPDRSGSCGRKGRRTSPTGRNRPMTARIEQVSSEGTNAWIIGDDEEVIVIDPGRDPAGVLGAVGEREVLAVICTHGHPDHVAAALEVAEGDEAPVALHPRDQLWWRDAYPEEDAEIEMADGGVFEVADVQLEVIHAPGHTPGSVCLYCEDLGAVFTRPTLTAAGPGPTAVGC